MIKKLAGVIQGGASKSTGAILEDTGGVPFKLVAKVAKGCGTTIKKLARVTQGGASKSTISVLEDKSGLIAGLVDKEAKGAGMETAAGKIVHSIHCITGTTLSGTLDKVRAVMSRAYVANSERLAERDAVAWGGDFIFNEEVRSKDSKRLRQLDYDFEQLVRERQAEPSRKRQRLTLERVNALAVAEGVDVQRLKSIAGK